MSERTEAREKMNHALKAVDQDRGLINKLGDKIFEFRARQVIDLLPIAENWWQENNLQINFNRHLIQVLP
jgi:hypothetical protein